MPLRQSDPTWLARIQAELDHKSRHFIILYRVETLRDYLETHLGATAKDIVRDLHWTTRTANQYLNLIRQEWRNRRCQTTKTQTKPKSTLSTKPTPMEVIIQPSNTADPQTVPDAPANNLTNG